MRCRALQYVAPRQVAIVDVDLPAVRSGEVLARTLYSGISSGTELLAYRGGIDPALPLDETIGSLAGTFRYPFRFGYSCVGLVEEPASDVPVNALVFAFHPHQERFVARASELVRVEGVDPRVTTLFPLIETGLQIALDVGEVHEDVVVVFGLGVVGTVAAALLQRAGADVVGVDPKARRRSTAARFGVRAASPEDVADLVAERSNRRGAAVAVEASGNPEALGAALELLAHEGTALVASWYGAAPVPLELGGVFHRRRLSLRSTQVSTIPARLGDRWDIARRRRVTRRLFDELPVKELATHEFAFADAPAAFAALDAGVEGLMHAALRYGQ